FDVKVCRKDDPGLTMPISITATNDPVIIYDDTHPAPATMSAGPGIPEGVPKFSVAPSPWEEYQASVSTIQDVNLLNVPFVIALGVAGRDVRPFLTETSPLTNSALA